VQRIVNWNWTIIGPLHEEEIKIIEKEFMKQDEATHIKSIVIFWSFALAFASR
jgi:hypothetical protein